MVHDMYCLKNEYVLLLIFVPALDLVSFELRDFSSCYSRFPGTFESLFSKILSQKKTQHKTLRESCRILQN